MQTHSRRLVSCGCPKRNDDVIKFVLVRSKRFPATKPFKASVTLSAHEFAIQSETPSPLPVVPGRMNYRANHDCLLFFNYFVAHAIWKVLRVSPTNVLGWMAAAVK